MQGHDSSSSSASPGLAARLAMGATAGALGQFVAVPADLVKVRMQADIRRVMSGKQHGRRYSSMAQTLQLILKQEGWRGLWRGGIPAIQRAALVNLGELATYDQAKQKLLASGYVSDGILLHTGASACSGFVASLISTPADVIKTRLMAQESTTHSRTAAATQMTPAAAYGSRSHGQLADGCKGGFAESPDRGSQGAAGLRKLSTTASITAGANKHYHGERRAEWRYIRSGGSSASTSSTHHSSTSSTFVHNHHATGNLGGTVGHKHPADGMCALHTARAVRACHHSQHQQYTGMMDCAIKTVQSEGVLALYKGFLPTWARLGPWQLVFWVSYEQMRHALHVESF
eukprot:jgi/Chrzof1/3324/Cz12g20280.t1